MKKRRFNLPYARGLVQYHLLKIKMVFGLVCALAFSVSASTFAQNERVTFHLTDVSIKHVLNEIQKQTQLSFIYNTEQLGHISVEARNEEVASLLDRIFANTGLTWKMQDAIILISQSSPCAKPQSQNEEFIQFSGIVTDASNTPLPGVTVKVQGSMFGTTTDANGKFRLNYPKSGSSNLVLEFSFIGMRTEKVKYAGQKEIKITLYEDEVELEEAIVTGYQVLDKRTLTSSITSVKAEDIMIPGVMSIDQMLEGRIPDMAFMLNSGEVGATPRLRVRGTSTLLGNREPLWVLDGIVMTDPVDVDPEDLNNPDYLNIIGNAIAGINPQDIERIDVLKDASATALYGTRAANGVIVVTTKKGRIGKPVLSYNHSSKFTRRPRYTDRNINLMNSQERVEFGKELTEQHYIF
uniref:SusC/RagA family TonB-linked outer membrane protein n=1 Tax=Parabacteroides goldsteinii TaxID=328812 RepID=UPI00259B2B1A